MPSLGASVYNFRMANMTLSFFYDPIDGKDTAVLASFLASKGFAVKTDTVFYPSDVEVIVMSGATTLKGLLSSNPWIKKELSHTSKGLRMMPLVVYDSKLEKLDDVWTNAEQIYSLMSGEFKPYAYDLASKEKSLIEFRRIIEEYKQ